MPLPLGAVLEMSIQGECLGQTILNVFHYEVTTVSTTPSVATEVTNFLTKWRNAAIAGEFMANFLACMPANYTVRKYTGQAIRPERYVRQAQVIPDIGSRENTSVSNLQASITFQTAFAGRSQVGGKRMLMTEVDADGGFISNALRGALTAFSLNCALPISVTAGGGIYTPIIYHRPPLIDTRRTIIGAFPQETVRVIRRRTVGLGI